MLNYLFFALVLGVVAGVSVFKPNRQGKAKWIVPAIFAAIVFVLFGAINYGAMPVLRLWNFDGIWIEIALAAAMGFVFWFFDAISGGSPKITKFQWVPLVLCLTLLGVRFATSAEAFHTSAYSHLLKVEEADSLAFENNIHPIPVEKMINVKKAYAEDIASKRIENIPAMGSRAEFGEADLINLNGSFAVVTAEGEHKTLTFDNEKVWVLPLEHRSFWKWHKFDVTDGYCIVSAHNPSRVFFITEVNGEKLALRYLRSGWFGDEIERHIRINGYAGYGLTEYSMELDDSGRPYWVITVFEPTIGFCGKDAKGVLVVDMQTGDITEYAINDAPEWVDRIQPDEFLLEQIEDWGQYQQGWWNSVLAQDGVRGATPGMSLVYSEGRSYWYSGIQSKGADKSASGFMLIDSRTKECKLYSTGGLNEESAKDAIESQSDWVRMSKLQANDPVLYNVHGIPTYYMTLTGDGIKNAGYAFLSLKNEMFFAAAETPQKALAEYQKVLQNGNQFLVNDGDALSQESVEMTLRGIVLEGETYYLIFNEIKGKEFTGSTAAFPELKWAKEGQKVKVSYTDTEAKVISLSSFDLLDFEI